VIELESVAGMDSEESREWRCWASVASSEY